MENRGYVIIGSLLVIVIAISITLGIIFIKPEPSVEINDVEIISVHESSYIMTYTWVQWIDDDDFITYFSYYEVKQFTFTASDNGDWIDCTYRVQAPFVMIPYAMMYCSFELSVGDHANLEGYYEDDIFKCIDVEILNEI